MAVISCLNGRHRQQAGSYRGMRTQKFMVCLSICAAGVSAGLTIA